MTATQTPKLDRLTKASFFARFASLVIVVCFGKSWDDHEGVEIGASTKELDASKIWTEIRDLMRNSVGDCRNHHRKLGRHLAKLAGQGYNNEPITIADFLLDLYAPFDLVFKGSKSLTVANLIDIIREAYDNCECSVRIMTKADYDAKQEAKEREEMERFASSFCQQHGLKSFGTVDFIRKLIEVQSSRVSRIESYREGMREDGLCIGYGVTADEWYDEYNAAAGDIANEEEMTDRVLTWLQTRCPLTWALWEEEMQANKQAEN